jgi:hypothetical protein
VAIVNWVLANYMELFQAVLALLGAFSIIAKLTPTQTDDKAIQWVLDMIHKLGLTK